MEEVSNESLRRPNRIEAPQIDGQQGDGDEREKDQTVANPPRPLSRRHRTAQRLQLAGAEHYVPQGLELLEHLT